MAGYFITGTDTNVGKTYVASALANRAVALGHKVFAFKPIETGCARDPNDEYVGADQEQLVCAAGGWQQGVFKGIYRFPLPAAPAVAARAAGAPPVDVELIASTIADGISASGASFTLVEGAGGWRVPVTNDMDMGGLARHLGLPVVIVARAALGTINHTLLTVEAVERDGIPIAAVVLSRRTEDDLAESNREEILRRWPGRILFVSDNPAVLDGLIPQR